MLVLIGWTVVLLLSLAAVCLVVSLAESSWTGGALASMRARLMAAGGCVLFLIVAAAAYESDSLASPDGHLIAKLASHSGTSLANAMTYVTLLGDSVPSLIIATLLAILIFRQGIHSYACAILPVAVLAELYAQLGMWKVFSDATIASMHPNIPIGGSGEIPSGSVARLLSIFLIASLLWRDHDARGASRIATLGAMLTVVQIVSRLVLGRHLFADILAGLALGFLLTLVATFVLPATVRGAPPRTAGEGSSPRPR